MTDVIGNFILRSLVFGTLQSGASESGNVAAGRPPCRMVSRPNFVFTGCTKHAEFLHGRFVLSPHE
jgi:hypothetical protein